MYNKNSLLNIINKCICETKSISEIGWITLSNYIHNLSYYIIIHNYPKFIQNHEDIAQSFLLHLYENKMERLKKYNSDIATPFTWLSSCLRNFIHNYIKKQENLKLKLSINENLYDFTENNINNKLFFDDIINFAENYLTNNEIEILILYYFNNYKTKQISNILNISHDCVRRHKCNGIKKLKKFKKFFL